MNRNRSPYVEALEPRTVMAATAIDQLHGLGSGVLATPPQTGPIYYVSPGGSDQNQGTTESAPLRTIAGAISRLTPGSTLLLAPGTYAESISGIRGGTSWTMPVRIAPLNPSQPPVLQPNSGEFGLLFDSSASAYVEITGLIVDGRNITQDAIRIMGTTAGGGAHHIRIVDTEIRNARQHGIHVTNPEFQVGYNEFIRVHVHHNGTTTSSNGIQIRTSNNLVANSRIHHNGSWGIGTDGGAANSNIYRDNVIHDQRTGGGIAIVQGVGNGVIRNLVSGVQIGIHVGASARGTEVRENNLISSSQSAIEVRPGSIDAVLSENQSWNNQTMLDAATTEALSISMVSALDGYQDRPGGGANNEWAFLGHTIPADQLKALNAYQWGIGENDQDFQFLQCPDGCEESWLRHFGAENGTPRFLADGSIQLSVSPARGPESHANITLSDKSDHSECFTVALDQFPGRTLIPQRARVSMSFDVFVPDANWLRSPQLEWVILFQGGVNQLGGLWPWMELKIVPGANGPLIAASYRGQRNSPLRMPQEFSGGGAAPLPVDRWQHWEFSWVNHPVHGELTAKLDGQTVFSAVDIPLGYFTYPERGSSFAWGPYTKSFLSGPDAQDVQVRLRDIRIPTCELIDTFADPLPNNQLPPEYFVGEFTGVTGGSGEFSARDWLFAQSPTQSDTFGLVATNSATNPSSLYNSTFADHRSGTSYVKAKVVSVTGGYRLTAEIQLNNQLVTFQSPIFTVTGDNWQPTLLSVVNPISDPLTGVSFGANATLLLTAGPIHAQTAP